MTSQAAEKSGSTPQGLKPVLKQSLYRGVKNAAPPQNKVFPPPRQATFPPWTKGAERQELSKD